jgi:hypothetical protein
MLYSLITSYLNKKLSLCLTISALRHEGVWGSGCIDSHILDLGTSWRSASRLGSSTPGERAPGTHWIGWVGPRAGLDDVERRRLSSSAGLEL